MVGATDEEAVSLKLLVDRHNGLFSTFQLNSGSHWLCYGFHSTAGLSPPDMLEWAAYVSMKGFFCCGRKGSINFYTLSLKTFSDSFAPLILWPEKNHGTIMVVSSHFRMLCRRDVTDMELERATRNLKFYVGLVGYKESTPAVMVDKI